jgi:hypothetical protein
MDLAGNYVSDAVDRAWQQIAADLTGAHPGWTVSYGVLGFTAVRGGVTIGPDSWGGIRALLDVTTYIPWDGRGAEIG